VRRKDEAWALFWCTLLHPVLFGEVEAHEVGSFLRRLAGEERTFPNGVRKKPSLSTLWRKLRQYQQGGFEALGRQARSDRGRVRAHDRALIERAITLKRDQARRSDETINQFLRAEFKKTLPKSTLYRYLRAAGATRLKLGIDTEPVRKRWTSAHTHDLWVGDFEDGPYALDGPRVVPTHLSAFIDCHSRYVPEGRYYYRETLDVVIDSFLRALAQHGAPGGIYVDWAKVYQARALQIACYRLHIRHLHRKAGDPPGGGVIERFFETVQSQFEAEVRAGSILTLDELNRAFSAWLEMSYHRRRHSETGEPPRERYDRGLTAIRPVDLEAAAKCFLRCEQRTVHRDFSDVRLEGHFYRVDRKLRGDRVEVRYDPFSDPGTVLIYSLDDQYLGKGILHQREQGEAAPRAPAAPKPQYNYLDLLVREHERELQAQARGIDYHRTLAPRPWPFTSFVQTLGRLLGRKGGLSGFATQELETLHKLYERFPQLSEPLLSRAFEQAPGHTLPHLLRELETLAQRKEP
jgi:transposase InsO family protein